MRDVLHMLSMFELHWEGLKGVKARRCKDQCEMDVRTRKDHG